MCPHGSINKTARGTEEAPARRLLELGGGGRGCDHQEEEWTERSGWSFGRPGTTGILVRPLYSQVLSQHLLPAQHCAGCWTAAVNQTGSLLAGR